MARLCAVSAGGAAALFEDGWFDLLAIISLYE
jgi:hypothetical protein